MNHLYFTRFFRFFSLIVLVAIANSQFVTAQSNISFSEESSFSTSATVDFKVTTVNAEWLSCSQNDPADDKLQINNIATLISTINPDVIALQEVGTSSTYATIDTLVKKMGSAWAGKIVPWSADNCDQNQGIIYKKSRIQLTSSSLVTTGGTSYNWSSGRYPALYNVSFIVSAGSSVPVSLFNIHAKAMSDTTSYNRRKAASVSLKSLLDGSTYNTKNVIILGDFNDYLIGSQCTSKTDSPYKNFIDDATNYTGLSKSLVDTYYSSPVIDNIIISNELSSALVSGSVLRETTATQKISSYSSTTSDHTPVSATFRFSIPTALVNLNDNLEISVFPNPAQNYLTVKTDLKIENIQLFNLTGNEVLKLNDISDKIDISKLPQGIYILRVKTEKGYYQQKLLKN